MLAARYNYTLDEFMKLTVVQIRNMLKIIDDQRFKEAEVQASLHGMKMKPRMQATNFDKKQDEKLNLAAKKALERMQREYGKSRTTYTDKRNS